MTHRTFTTTDDVMLAALAGEITQQEILDAAKDVDAKLGQPLDAITAVAIMSAAEKHGYTLGVTAAMLAANLPRITLPNAAVMVTAMELVVAKMEQTADPHEQRVTLTFANGDPLVPTEVMDQIEQDAQAAIDTVLAQHQTSGDLATVADAIAKGHTEGVSDAAA